MQVLRSAALRGVGAQGLALCLAAVAATSAAGQGGIRSIRTKGEFLAYDAAARTVTVKVIQPGTGPEAKALERGKPSRFRVEPEGPLSSRTSVAIRGVKGELSDLAAGQTVYVYWYPDEAQPGARFARKIDVILSDEEINERYGTE